MSEEKWIRVTLYTSEKDGLHNYLTDVPSSIYECFKEKMSFFEGVVFNIDVKGEGLVIIPATSVYRIVNHSYVSPNRKDTND